jgi:hypothetical protein
MVMMMMMMVTMTQQQQQQQQQLSEMALMAVGSDVSVYEWAVMVAGIFMIFSLALSTFLLFDHLSTYNDPEEQKWLIGVIFMVPVYVVTSVCCFNPVYSKILRD